MKFDFCKKNIYRGGNVKDNVKGFCSADRFIILSDITSDTIPNILDMFFNFITGVNGYVDYSSRKTRVMVINRSVVYGTYYDARDSRTRNVFIHHGVADCPIEMINSETPIMFTDVDWNVIVDSPDVVNYARKNGQVMSSIPEVRVSYDTEVGGDVNLYREGRSTKEILIPSPEFYEEKDMVLTGDKEESYIYQVSDSKERIFMMPENRYNEAFYTLKLEDLIDPNTKIMKLNIKVDNLSSRNYGESFNEFISETCSQVKYAMEKYGFSSGEFILDDHDRYNIRNLKSYLEPTQFEQRVNFMCLCSELDRVMDYVCGVLKERECTLIMTLNYANVNVKVIDRYPSFGEVTKTDTNVRELSNVLKESYAQCGGFYGNC